ncbi:MAG: DUF116 domain-containing protein [Anaerolineae bacterium]|nr:DUF116 domain-containing protein [Anaerolineae bacterium]
MDAVDDLACIPFAQRVLLLPHCLRPSQECIGKMGKAGLECGECAIIDCAIYKLRAAATSVGYGGICIAPGGRLAVRFLAEKQPAGVVAIACHKELQEGQETVEGMSWSNGRPVLVAIPLTQDGCVDTLVDVELAIRIITASNGHPGDDSESRKD